MYNFYCRGYEDSVGRRKSISREDATNDTKRQAAKGRRVVKYLSHDCSSTSISITNCQQEREHFIDARDIARAPAFRQPQTEFAKKYKS